MPETGEILLDGRPIAFTVGRSKRRRRTIAFRMATPSVLEISAPMRASEAWIRSALKRQSGWIRKRSEELQKETAHASRFGFHDGAEILYLGHICNLVVRHDKNSPQGCALLPRRLIVNLHAEARSEELSHEVRLEILLWLKRRAKTKLQKRLDLWAKRLGVRYRKFTATNAEQRWGSCSAGNNIRLNWKLIMAPLPILDYVAVHELCHVRHKNHGPRFWAQVASAMPDWQVRRKQLHHIGGRLRI